ncbi:MAG TPA: IclR family transcriptional regulator [Terriglobia bacterium]|nr:IclR family transcriptional regulator [Terriglobia bacterium]
MAQRYLVPAIKRAFDVIELLAEQEAGLGVSEVRRALGLPLSSVANILYTLTDLRYLERDERDTSYRLSVKLLGIAGRAQERMDTVAQCRSLLEDAVRESGLTGHLAVLRDGEAMYVARTPSNSMVQVNSYVGQRWPLYISAAGKALLAFVPEGKLERMVKQLALEKRTPHTITGPAALVRQLRSFRRLGYTWERNEGEMGLGCVGAPVFGPEREVVAALSLSGTTHQVSAPRIPALGSLAKKYAAQMSRRLGAKI